MLSPRPVLLALPLVLAAACSDGGSGTPLALSLPAAPGALVATPVGPNQVRLTWQDLALVESGFEIQRGNGTFEVVGNLPADRTVFVDTYPPGRVPWEYRVRAFNRGGESAFSNSVFVTPPLPPPPTLTGAVPTRVFDLSTSEVVLTGSGFADFLPGINLVTFDGLAGTVLDVPDDGTLLVRPPAGRTGSSTVALANLNGNATLGEPVTVYPWPVELIRSRDPLARGSGGTVVPGSLRVASSGSELYAVWEDTRDGGSGVYFNRSTDAGRTWGTSTLRLDTGGGDATQPDVAVGATGLHVVWQDTRDGAEDVYSNRSLDGGVTWLVSDVRVDQDAAGSGRSTSPKVVVRGGVVHVAWLDDRNTFTNAYVNRSDDAGASFSATDVRVESVAAVMADLELRATDSGLCAVWADSRFGLQDLFASHSTDGGATWSGSATRLTTNPQGGAVSEQAHVVADGDDVFVVWQDDRNGLTDVFFNRSTDGGATWLAADVRLDTNNPGARSSDGPRLAREGANLVVAWADGRTNGPLRVNRSLDGGATWLEVDEAPFPDAIDPTGIEVVLSAGNAFLVWTDSRDGAPAVLLSSSTDGGATWQPSELRVSGDTPLPPTSTRVAGTPLLLATGARASVLWEEEVDGAFRLASASSTTRSARSKEQATTRRPPPGRTRIDGR